MSLTINAGEVVSLLGSSGCGKSTLVRIVGGLLRPDAGDVFCDGVPLEQPYSPVSVVFQDYDAAVFPWFTARKNIVLACGGGSIDHSKIDAAAAQIGIQPLLTRYPSTLSGGEKQRVQIARALVSEPRYLLMDEPSSSLDLELRKTLLELTSDLAQSKGLGVLLVTHNIDEAVYVSDRLYLAKRDDHARRLLLMERNGYGRRVADLGQAHRDADHYGQLYEEVYRLLFSPAAAWPGS